MVTTKFFDWKGEEKRIIEELKEEIHNIQTKEKNDIPKQKNTT
ncbi:hypothetical protein OFO16_15315 [Vibrio natriegens]|nr:MULTISPECIES: hypothetical protein [Vibrio]EDL52678.1 hypothetical protein VSAK1_24515 [Vibrio mediterranei AK1]UYI47094.1 hypothetical protein OFO16_15315 [Vibrio natriegens]